jgi:hypothetical protein
MDIRVPKVFSQLFSFQKKLQGKTGPTREGELSPPTNSAQKPWFWPKRSHPGPLFPPLLVYVLIFKKPLDRGKKRFWGGKEAQ